MTKIIAVVAMALQLYSYSHVSYECLTAWISLLGSVQQASAL